MVARKDGPHCDCLYTHVAVRFFITMGFRLHVYAQMYYQYFLVNPLFAIQSDNQVFNVRRSRLWRYELALLNAFLTYNRCMHPETRIGDCCFVGERSQGRFENGTERVLSKQERIRASQGGQRSSVERKKQWRSNNGAVRRSERSTEGPIIISCKSTADELLERLA